MPLVEIMLLSPFAFGLGWMLEPPFGKYVLPLLQAFGRGL